MNYSELLQLAKGWGNFVSDRINIWRLQCIEYNYSRTPEEAEKGTIYKNTMWMLRQL